MSDVKGKSTSGRGLTPKQEKFCQLYIEFGNASEAYRQAYSASNMSLKTINEEANALLNNPKITPRIAELQNDHKKRHDYTVDNLLAKLERIYSESMERETPNFNAATSAVMGQAKILGFDKKIVDVTSGGNALPAVININFSDEPEEP